MSFKKTFLPALILSAICLVSAAALALTNHMTAERIANVERERYLASAKAVLPEGAHLSELLGEDISGFVGRDDAGAPIGYAFKTSAKGYGGNVTCVVGFDTTGKIIGISVHAPEETPGLGSNVTGSAFTDAFLGAEKPPVLGEDVDAVTGASYSSRAVEAAVRQAFAAFEKMTKGE